MGIQQEFWRQIVYWWRMIFFSLRQNYFRLNSYKRNPLEFQFQNEMVSPVQLPFDKICWERFKNTWVHFSLKEKYWIAISLRNFNRKSSHKKSTTHYLGIPTIYTRILIIMVLEIFNDSDFIGIPEEMIIQGQWI